MFKKTLLAAAMLAFGGVAITAQAATTDTFHVNMTILKSCSVTAGSASDIQIGAATGVTADSGSNDGHSTIQVLCSKGTNYSVGLQPSNGNQQGAGTMTGSSGDSVPYQLHSGSATGPTWGTAAAKNNGPVNGTGNGAQQSLDVFAVAPDANYTPGDYSDVVTVNLSF